MDPRVSRDGVPLCPHHADKTTPPMGWTMNDLRSRDRTLAPVRSIGPRTGEVVSNPRPRAVGSPLFQDSRYEAEAERAAERAAERLRAAARGEALEDDDEDDTGGLSFPVSQELRHMPVSAARPPVEVVPQHEIQPEPEPAVSAEVTRATARRGGWAAAISGVNAAATTSAPTPKAPASRPSKRREVVEEAPEPEEERFPFHFSFKEADTEEPQGLKAKTPLLARAFRSSVG
ncbi:MAG: hypothetical protein R2761_24680 [Acidimicrobiales bacterium]